MVKGSKDIKVLVYNHNEKDRLNGLIFVGNHVTFPVLLAKLGYSYFNEKLKMVAIESS